MALQALVGALRASLSLDTVAFEDGSKRAQSQADRLARNITRTLKTIGVGFTFQQVISAFKSVIDQADRLQETAQKIGVPIEQLQGLELAARTTGVSFEQLTAGVGRLSKAMQSALTNTTGEAARAFQTLGISLQQVRSANASEALLLLADGFNRTSDGARKTAAALTLLGRGAGLDLIPLLNQGSAELQRFLQIADSLGIVIDQRTAVSADRFNDNLVILKAALEGVTTQLVVAMLPALERLVQALADTATGASPLQRVIQTLTQTFRDWVFQIEAVGTRLENLQTTFSAIRQIGQIPLRDILFGEGLDQAAAIWAKRTAEIEANFRSLDAAYSQLNNSINNRGGIGGGGGIGGTIGGTSGGAAEAPLIEVPKKAKPFWDGLSRSVKLTAEEMGKLKPITQELGNIFDGVGAELGDIFLDAVEGTKSLAEGFKELANDILRQVVRMLTDRAFQQFISLIGGFGSSAFNPGVGPGGLGFTDFGGPRAAGGRVRRGKFNVVGERGPELFIPRTAGSVVPNSALGSGPNIKIIDQRTTASAPIQSRQGGDGSMEFIVRDTVRKELPGALRQTLPTQFGARPRLTQRGN